MEKLIIMLMNFFMFHLLVLGMTHPEAPYGNGKNRQDANLGVSCLFEYRDEEGGVDSGLGQRTFFPLLHSLAPDFLECGLGGATIPD